MKTKSFLQWNSLNDAVNKLETAARYMKDGGEPMLTNKLNAVISEIKLALQNGYSN